MPRAKQSMDGNTAAAHVAYAFTDVAAIYPITPSSPMADTVDQWSAAGLKNIFGNQVKVVEMESEAGAAGAVHGSLGTGAITTTFTASQGLLLMIPNMYKIAAEQLPCVFDVSARTVATQSLNIFGDHSDVMAVRQTGFAMLAESNPQEVMDLSPVAHLSAIEGHVPFVNFFDGFRTSHEIQKIEKWDYEDLKEMCNMEAVEEFRAKALNPEHPKMRGSHENGDVFFQHREACNPAYEALPAVVEKYMAKINEKLGTNYDLFNYYGAEDADRVIIAMGSICDVAEEVVDYLTAKGEKVGLVLVRLYRPWVSSALLKVLPKTVKKIAVLDRTKEPGSLGEPLYLDVATTLREAGMNDVVLTGGRHRPGAQALAPQRTVDDGLLSPQGKKALRHRPQLRGDRGPRQLHIAGAAGAHDDHLAQRGRDTCGHQNLLCHIAQPQHILGRGDQCTLTDKDTRFFRAGDHICGLAVPPDGGQSQRAPQMARRQQPVEHGGLARVLAHTHDGHGLCFIEPAYQLLVHGVHALSLVFSQFLSITYPFEKRKGGKCFPPLSLPFVRMSGASCATPHRRG